MEQSKKKSEEVGSKLSDFKIIKELGKGSYGTVYTVKSYLNSNIYVMKKMELNHLTARQQIECYREVSILKKVCHKNIIKYYSSFLDKDILYIIMEYAELGDLYSLIKHYKKHSKNFTEIDLWKISSEVLSGLDYLHSHNIIHRDIKCLNLFITKDRHIKIGDLGVSAFTSGMNDLHYTRVGTPLYISPELVKQKPYDYKTDIWSFGCSLYHLASLEPPFTGGNLIVLGNNIVKGVPKPLPQQYSTDLRNFVDKLLEKKADKRPSAKEALDLIPLDIVNDMKVKGEKIVIKSKRPFSSAVNGKNIGNKIITVNKEEIKSLFADDTDNDNNEKNIKINNKKEEKNITNKDDINNNNNNKQESNKNNKKDINTRNKSEENNKLLSRNDADIQNILSYMDNNFKSYNDLKEKKENLDENIHKQKKLYDLSFNIPSFNNQKGFNKFRKKQNKKHKLIIEHNFPGFTLSHRSDKFNPHNFNNLNMLSPIYKNNNISKRSLKQYLQHNLIEKNKKREFKDFKKNVEKEAHNDNFINNQVKNINIINIIPNITNPKKNKEEKNDKNNNLLLRLNTDNNQYPSNNKINFPELNKNLKNNTNEESLKNKNPTLNNTKDLIKNKFKRMTSAKPLPLRPLTSELNKNVISFNNRIRFNNDIFNNNINLLKTKENLNSDTNRNYIEANIKKNNIRPMTGFHSQINNNVMNININFYNIDMNKKFLIPEMNPYNTEQHDNNIRNVLEDTLMETKKFKNISNTNIISDLDLDKYKDSNEFLFQKIIRSIQEINGNNKRLTIKDLV